MVASLAVLGYLVSRPIADAYIYAHVVFHGHEITLGQLWGAGFIVVLLAYLLTVRQKLRWSLAALLPTSFLIAYGVFTISRPQAHFAVVAGSRLAAWLLVIWAFASIAETRDGQERSVVAVYATAALLIAVIGVEIARNRYGAAYYDQARNVLFRGPGAVFQAPYEFSSFAVFAAPFMAIGLLRRTVRLLSFVLLALLAVCVFLSLVRTTYIALLIIILAFAAVAARAETRLLFRDRRVFVASVAGLLALITALAVAYQHVLVNRFTHGSGRLHRWQVIFDAVIHHSTTRLIGGGAGYSRRVWGMFIGVPNGDWAHNDFLELLATGGPLLLLLYLAVIAWMFSSFWRVYKDRRQTARTRNFMIACFGALLAFLVTSFGSGIIFSAPAILFGALVGLARGFAQTPGQTVLDEPGRRADPGDPSPDAGSGSVSRPAG